MYSGGAWLAIFFQIRCRGRRGKRGRGWTCLKRFSCLGTMSPSVAHSRLTSLGDVTPNNIGQLKKLNSILFPVNYGPNFYDDVLQSGELAKLGRPFDVTSTRACRTQYTRICAYVRVRKLQT